MSSTGKPNGKLRGLRDPSKVTNECPPRWPDHLPSWIRDRMDQMCESAEGREKLLEIIERLETSGGLQ